MPTTPVVTELDRRFSAEDARPLPWEAAAARLESAEVFWLSTVRSDGRPHVTPVIALWLDGALLFCTGPTEQKVANLAANSHCIVTTGCNTLNEGLDLVVEGVASRVTDATLLQRAADGLMAKYPGWEFEAGDAFLVDLKGGHALLFQVTPSKVFGFDKGDAFGQTRWRFSP